MAKNNKIKEKEEKLIELTKAFCTEKLDDDYLFLCKKLIKKLGRKHHVPFATGRIEIWAAGIIYALGSINFLFDKSFEPYVTGDEICDYFNVKKSSVSGKSKVIRDLLNLGYYDSEFSTGKMQDNNPFNNMVMLDGFVVPLDKLPIETQEFVKKARAEGKDIELFTK